MHFTIIALYRFWYWKKIEPNYTAFELYLCNMWLKIEEKKAGHRGVAHRTGAPKLELVCTSLTIIFRWAFFQNKKRNNVCHLPLHFPNSAIKVVSLEFTSTLTAQSVSMCNIMKRICKFQLLAVWGPGGTTGLCTQWMCNTRIIVSENTFQYITPWMTREWIRSKVEQLA